MLRKLLNLIGGSASKPPVYDATAHAQRAKKMSDYQAMREKAKRFPIPSDVLERLDSLPCLVPDENGHYLASPSRDVKQLELGGWYRLPVDLVNPRDPGERVIRVIHVVPQGQVFTEQIGAWLAVPDPYFNQHYHLARKSA